MSRTNNKHQGNHTNTSNNTSDIIAQPSLINDKNRSELDAVTEEVKQDLRGLFGKTAKLIEKLGNAVKKVVKKEESICEEIKIRLKEEIAEGVISTRTIELHCPDEWKRRTKPKQRENEKISFSKVEEKTQQQQIAATQDGKSVIINETPMCFLRVADDICIPTSRNTHKYRNLRKRPSDRRIAGWVEPQRGADQGSSGINL